MNKHLFFDDIRLFDRSNTVRRYGVPVRVATYKDPVCSTDFGAAFAFPLDDGRYRLLYYGRSRQFAGSKFFAAISNDGIHFEPENLDGILPPDRTFSHEVLDLKSERPVEEEVGFVYEDPTCRENGERYKLLMSALHFDELRVHNDLYVSDDLLHWTKKEGCRWGGGNEPLVSVFYNERLDCHTIIERPFWGIRAVGYRETIDWKTLSEYQYCLRADSLDECLSETYGMVAFAYDGMFIGLPHLYRNLTGSLEGKYLGGTIDTQLAYSYDGRYWQRSLREPFITGLTPAEGEKRYPMVWVMGMVRCADGSMNLYAAASEWEHGYAFGPDDTGEILVYKLRQDGFVALVTEDSNKPSVVATREKLWYSGELHVNLKAQNATVAVYATGEPHTEDFSRPIAGFGHEDCVPFSGDCTDWVPQYAGGKQLQELAGQTIVLEIRFENGELYSLCGDYTDLFNTEGMRYRKFGLLPEWPAGNPSNDILSD